MARISLGRVLHRLGRFAEAIEQLERGVAIVEELEATLGLEGVEASAIGWIAEAREALVSEAAVHDHE